MSCGPRAEIVEMLSDRHDEVRTAGGLQGQSQLMEIWASPEYGTWTLLVTRANGITCIAAHGTDWVVRKPQPAGLPS
ncbi:hypothetical protein [Pseudoponticoccus marisrubri]|nr:hypothetical protein [Pseudoponticoccus marisrubri]